MWRWLALPISLFSRYSITSVNHPLWLGFIQNLRRSEVFSHVASSPKFVPSAPLSATNSKSLTSQEVKRKSRTWNRGFEYYRKHRDRRLVHSIWSGELFAPNMHSYFINRKLTICIPVQHLQGSTCGRLQPPARVDAEDFESIHKMTSQLKVENRHLLDIFYKRDLNSTENVYTFQVTNLHNNFLLHFF